MQILVVTPTPEAFDDRVHRISADADVVHARPGDEPYADAVRAAEIILGRPPVDDVPKAPKLRWMQLSSAGANTYVGRISDDITLTTASGVYGIPVSEHTFALMLGFTRSIHTWVKDQAAGRWARSADILELYGSTCGILGMGDIGMAVAHRARAFGMHVLAVRRSPDRQHDDLDEVVGADEVETMLGRSDFVVNTLPETNDTRHFLDRGRLRAIKKGGVLVNVGRGTTVDERSLIDLLKDGHLAGAALDVFDEEPLPEDSELWQMPNVIITPHVGGASPREQERVADLFVENFRRYVEGERLLNVVDLRLGY